jgi:PKD repeat protein
MVVSYCCADCDSAEFRKYNDRQGHNVVTVGQSNQSSGDLALRRHRAVALFIGLVVLLAVTFPASATTISETFNQADSTTLGPTLTWTETDGDLRTVSNHVEGTSPGILHAARAESDLASSDMFSQAEVTFRSGSLPTVVVAYAIARYSSSTPNYYGVILYTVDSGVSYKLGLRKRISLTQDIPLVWPDFDVTSSIVPGTPNTIRIEVEGTSPTITLRAYLDGGLKQTVTGETGFDGQRRAGLALYWDTTTTTNYVTLDNFQAGDLGGSGGGQANVTGQWSTLPYTMPINPIHVGVLRTGRVLIVAGSEADPIKHQEGSSKAAVWDLQSGTITVQDPLWDLFCNGMAFLPDGRALVIGGTEAYDPFYGDARATVFDPQTEKFVQVESMAHGRWYATATAMDDGRILTFSGLDETSTTNQAVELYRVAYGWGPEAVAPWTPPLYPWLHLLPNGRVFYSGYGPNSNIFDPATSTWSLNVATTAYGQLRWYGSSVLLPLLPENGYAPRVMIMGGSISDQISAPATATAEIIDLSQQTPHWQLVPPMSRPRVQMNATILPNGKVLATGGSASNEDESTASLAADLFDPVTKTWSPAGSASYARLYHSVALLLPDATVMTAGSNPSAAFANSPNRGAYQPHIEIWTPPYLFTTDASGNVVPAARPTISAAPASIGYAGSFQVQSPNAADITSVVLIRPGSPTHAFDMEQRLVGLSFSAAGSTLTVSGPPNARIVPPGYYMLFILNGQGVPSIASFVQVSATSGNQPPKGTITQPAGDVTIQAGQSVTFGGSGFDPDGAISRFAWIFPDGGPNSSTNQNPGVVTFPSAGTFVASLTVVDSLGDTDPSPPTRTVTVLAGTNQPPTANPGGPYSGTTLQAIQFDGTGSSDSDGSIASYTWTFGDGSTGTGATPTHAYATSGAYTVTLTVTDNNGASNTNSTTATALNQAPTANPGGPYSGIATQGIKFNGSGSSDLDGTITSYAWTFGDGSTGTGATPTHAYATSGVYTVALTVTDNNGASSSASTTATVQGPPNAPSNLGATVSTKRKVILTWVDNSNNETGFKIEQSTNGTTFAQIATVGANVTTYTDGGNQTGTYYFRVRAYNGAGNSAYSNTVTVQIR